MHEICWQSSIVTKPQSRTWLELSAQMCFPGLPAWISRVPRAQKEVSVRSWNTRTSFLDALHICFRSELREFPSICILLYSQKPKKQRLNQKEQVCFIGSDADWGMPKITKKTRSQINKQRCLITLLSEEMHTETLNVLMTDSHRTRCCLWNYAIFSCVGHSGKELSWHESTCRPNLDGCELA